MGLTTKYSPAELTVRGQIPSRFGPPMDIFTTPITPRENTLRLYQGKTPMWPPFAMGENTDIMIDCDPENKARSPRPEGVSSDTPINDGYGVDWVYVDVVGGAMVRPGNPYMEDISEWREKIVWPDLDSWDWEGSAKINNGTFLKKENFNQMWFQTGFYERLIAFMEFEGAIMALFDEDSQPEVHAFFDKLTDFYIDLFKHVIKYFPDVNAVFFHDDWGSQKETFFSPAIAEEMIVPYMRRLTDFLHANGIFCELHSCGNNYKQVPNYIKAGWDAWAPQLMNDSYKIYDDFGDKILIATFPQNIPEEIMKLPTTDEQGAAFAKLPEEEQRRIAREYADRVCVHGKPSFYNFYAAHWLTPAFREELYKESRINYSK